MGEDPRRRKQEVAALQLGLELGMTLIDTAEMYGNGAAEELVSEAIVGRRDEVFLVTKAYPHNASPKRLRAACERSLKRLKSERIDLYLLHWRGSVPLQDTVDGFTSLQQDGLIRHWGVSNFDLKDMKELVSLAGGARVATNQVLYNLASRGIEWDLLPWFRACGLPIMAYSPLGQGSLLRRRELQAVATRYSAAPAQIALAWLLRQPEVMVIPKAGRPEHVKENYRALEMRLTETDLHELDHAFSPPSNPTPLEII